jgi:hypothetical protein
VVVIAFEYIEMPPINLDDLVELVPIKVAQIKPGGKKCL